MIFCYYKIICIYIFLAKLLFHIDLKFILIFMILSHDVLSDYFSATFYFLLFCVRRRINHIIIINILYN